MKTFLKALSAIVLISLLAGACRYFPPRQDKMETAESIIETLQNVLPKADDTGKPAETPETPAEVDTPPNEAEATAKAEAIQSGSVMLDSFNKIAYKGPGTLTLVQGDLTAFQVETSQELMDKLYYEVKEGKLIIQFQHLSWDQFLADDLKVTISFFDINEIEVEGPVTLKIDAFKGDTFEVELKGAFKADIQEVDVKALDVELKGTGLLTIKGKANDQKVEIQGAAKYEAADLESESVFLDIEGAGFAKVWAKTNLTLDLKGGYTVEYWGNPNVHQNVKGVGTILHKGEK